MEDRKIVWQQPVKQSNLTDHDWVHYRASFHAFQNHISLCGKYGQDTNFFETDFNPNEHSVTMKCKKCLKLLL